VDKAAIASDRGRSSGRRIGHENGFQAYCLSHLFRRHTKRSNLCSRNELHDVSGLEVDRLEALRDQPGSTAGIEA
jgi:hypothetical protein